MYFIFVSGKETKRIFSPLSQANLWLKLVETQAGSRFLHFFAFPVLLFPHLSFPPSCPSGRFSPSPTLLCHLLSLFLVNTAPGICVIHVIWGAQAGGNHRQAWHLRVSVSPSIHPTGSQQLVPHLSGMVGKKRKSVVDQSRVPKSKTEVHRWIPILHRWILLHL